MAKARKTATRLEISRAWVRLAHDERAIEQGYYFDPEKAAHACEFFEAFLRHTLGKWRGKPFILELWQRDYLSRLYGWRRPDGTRRFRESYVEIPKKNGKSTLIAGICIYELTTEPGAEVYPGACNKKQAGIIFKECARMIKGSADLKKHLKVIAYNNVITFEEMDSRLAALSADADSADGFNASCSVLDEVHRFKNRALYDVMKYAGAARDQPLLLSITTAGIEGNSLCKELHNHAKSIIDGSTDDLEFLPLIYAADPEDDLDDRATWGKANPSLGTIISEDDFRREYEQAKRIPGRLHNFKRLRLNIWTEQYSQWLSVPDWNACARKINLAQFGGKTCYAALDLSAVKDLTSLSLVFPDDRKMTVINFFFMPGETAAERSEADGVPYVQWIEDGHMLETEGNATDFAAIRKLLNDLAPHLDIVQVGLDGWNARQLMNELEDDGFEVVTFGQSYATLTGPSKHLERLLLDGLLAHDGNPCLGWCVGNAVIETDAAGNIKPSKRKSKERIDGVVSMVMGIGLAISAPNYRGPVITYV